MEKQVGGEAWHACPQKHAGISSQPTPQVLRISGSQLMQELGGGSLPIMDGGLVSLCVGGSTVLGARSPGSEKQ